MVRQLRKLLATQQLVGVYLRDSKHYGTVTEVGASAFVFQKLGVIIGEQSGEVEYNYDTTLVIPIRSVDFIDARPRFLEEDSELEADDAEAEEAPR